MSAFHQDRPLRLVLITAYSASNVQLVQPHQRPQAVRDFTRAARADVGNMPPLLREMSVARRRQSAGVGTRHWSSTTRGDGIGQRLLVNQRVADCREHRATFAPTV